MRKFLLINILLFCVSFAFAQEIYDNDTIYSVQDVDVKPQFPGGEKELYKWLSENQKEFTTLRHYAGSYKGICIFTVDKFGNVKNVRITKSSGIDFFDDEYVRVIQLMPKWQPAEKNGEKVSCDFILPITIIFKI